MKMPRGIKIKAVIEPELNKEHKYAWGLRVEGGIFAPIKTYSTTEELEREYMEVFRAAKQSGQSLPIAVEKVDEGVEWDKARCLTLPEIIQKAIDENRKDRN